MVVIFQGLKHSDARAKFSMSAIQVIEDMGKTVLANVKSWGHSLNNVRVERISYLICAFLLQKNNFLTESCAVC